MVPQVGATDFLISSSIRDTVRDLQPPALHLSGGGQDQAAAILSR